MLLTKEGEFVIVTFRNHKDFSVVRALLPCSAIRGVDFSWRRGVR